MRQRGLIIIGWNDWFGSAYFPAIPKPYFTDGHPDKIDLKEAEEFGREMVERSRKIYQGETDLIPTFPVGKEYDEIYDPAPRAPAEIVAEYSRIEDNMELKINPAKCKHPKCSICADHCPMDCIDFSQSPVVRMMACDRCWLCEQACPTGP